LCLPRGVSNTRFRAEQRKTPGNWCNFAGRRRAILIALLVDLWLGGFFAWCARARLLAGGPWTQPSATVVALFGAIIVCPSTAYLYLVHPDWAWLYLVDPGRVPRLAVVPVVAAGAAALGAGYYGAARLLREADRRVLPAVLGGLGVLALLAGFLARERLGRYGSYVDWHAGRALPLAEVKLGYVLVAVVVGTGAAAGFVGWELWRDARRAMTR
jgi:hypothetical protein